MSKGLGRTMRAALTVLEVAAKDPMGPDSGLVDSITVAALALGKETVAPAEAVTYRRALRGLVRRGLAVDMGRAWHNKRRRWATPAAASAYIQANERSGWRTPVDVAARVRAVARGQDSSDG